MHCTSKECNVSPCTEQHEDIKNVPIAQAAAACDDPETGVTTVLTLNEAAWMGDTMEHALVNPNQLRAHGITVQDNPFASAPICMSTEGRDLVMPLTSEGTMLGVSTRTPTDHELKTCLPHIELSSDHEWDPQNVSFSEA
jgi:hypothetical protein